MHKGKDHQEGEIWEKPLHVQQCEPNTWAQGSVMRLSWVWGAGEEERKSPQLPLLSKKGWFLLYWYHWLAVTIETLWEIKVKKGLSTHASFFFFKLPLKATWNFGFKWLQRNISELLQNRGGRSKVFPRKVTGNRCVASPWKVFFLPIHGA